MPDTPTGGVAHVRYTKWDGSLHWHFDAGVVERDAHGTWLLVPPGGSYRRGTGTPRIEEHGFVVLVPPTDWWTAYFNAVPRGASGHLVYVDVATSPVWTGDLVTMIDLDLDVVLPPTGGAAVVDEDEFDEHRVRYSYPPDVVDRARTTAARVAAGLDAGFEPFGRTGPGLVARLLGWSHGAVVVGHGVASGVAGDPRFPAGTLAEQFPAFERAGLPIGAWHRATLNVHLGFVMAPVAPRLTIHELTWKHGYPAESFSFFDARVAVGGRMHDALVYLPHADTKPEFHQPAGVVELLAPHIPDVGPGTPVSVWIDPAQAGFVVA